MKPEIGRRQLFKFSFLSIISIFLGKFIFSEKSKNNDIVTSYYKINVPTESALQLQINNVAAINHLNVFSALGLETFDPSWMFSYDNAKHFALNSSALLKSEKIYSDRSHSLYIKSTWSSIENYVEFLDKANMKSFHKELKKWGYEPELKVFNKTGQINDFKEYV